MRDYLKLILVTEIAMLIAVVLNIQIARQIIGFVYVSFIPGILIIGILKLNLGSKTDNILFSAGLSIAFLMAIGLVANGLYPLLGISGPLSPLPLLLTVSVVLFAITFICGKRSDISDLNLSFSFPRISQVLTVSLLSVVPALAIIGASYANTSILLLMIIATVTLVAITVFFRKLIPPWLHLIVILVVAISLLFHNQFLSRYLLGWDVFGEFYVFRLTSTNSWWNPAAISSTVTQIGPNLFDYNGMLSVTMLPTIYSNLLNVPGELIFKFGYLLIFSIVPVAMYQMYKQGFGKSIAFLSAFYFVLNPRFYFEERRQIIGELLVVLLLFLILDRNLDLRKRKILLCAFGAALVVSHYSLSYIFMFCVLSAWAFTHIIRKIPLIKSDPGAKQLIDADFVLLIVGLNIFWYIIVTPAEGQMLIDVINHIITSFTTNFLNLESRGGTVSEFIAPNLGNMTLVYKADYIINKIPYFLLIIGLLALFRNFKKMNIQLDYLPMVLANISILLMVLVVPSFAPAFLADRFFHVSLLFLAPVCIFGGVTLVKWILRPFGSVKRARAVGLRVICILLIVSFLFKVGFVYEIAGDSSMSRPVSYMRERASNSSEIKAGLYEWYVTEQEVYGAVWLSHMTENDSKTYADETASEHVLRAYSMRLIEWKYLLFSERTIEAGAYVYLRYLNVQGLIKEHGVFSNTTEISRKLSIVDKIYSNGGSEIYYSLPSV